jgi:uncharacterized protein YndB with AHSA1/START domain
MTTESLTEEKTSDTIAVCRVVSQPVKKVWSALLTPPGQIALLGAGARLGDKGDAWQADDGSCGVTRSYHPLEEVRFSWRASETAPRTMVTLNLLPDGDSTTVEIRHDHAGADLDVARLSAHWQGVLDFLASA